MERERRGRAEEADVRRNMREEKREKRGEERRETEEETREERQKDERIEERRKTGYRTPKYRRDERVCRCLGAARLPSPAGNRPC